MKAITYEQAKRLNEIGIDPNTADLWYYESTFGEVVTLPSGFGKTIWEDESHVNLQMYRRDPNSEVAIVKRKETPCWSLTALIDLMPECLYIEPPHIAAKRPYYLEIDKDSVCYIFDDTDTGEIKVAPMKYEVSIDMRTRQPIRTKKIVIERSCVYRQALNKKNFIKRLLREGIEVKDFKSN